MIWRKVIGNIGWRSTQYSPLSVPFQAMFCIKCRNKGTNENSFQLLIFNFQDLLPSGIGQPASAMSSTPGDHRAFPERTMDSAPGAFYQMPPKQILTTSANVSLRGACLGGFKSPWLLQIQMLLAVQLLSYFII